MAEAEKGSEEQPGKVEPKPEEKSTPRNYSEDEFKEVVQQRQELKERLRALEEAESKRQADIKAAAEQKAIEEGKMKEVLDAKEKELESLKAKAVAYEEQQAKLRKSLVAQLEDDTDKKVAKEIASLDVLQEFVDARKQDKSGPYGGKGKNQPPKLDLKNFKGSYDDAVAMMRAAGVPIDLGE